MILKDILTLGEGQDEFERKIVKKGQSYPLHLLIKRLQSPAIEPVDEKKLSDEDLGLVYASLTLNQPKINYVSFADYRLGDPRELKKRFQETTRAELYLLIHHLEVGNFSFQDLKNNYQNKLNSSLLQTNFKEGLEHEIWRIIFNGMDFESITKAVKIAAEGYYQEFYLKGLDRRFIEYNRVQAELKKV